MGAPSTGTGSDLLFQMRKGDRSATLRRVLSCRESVAGHHAHAGSGYLLFSLFQDRRLAGFLCLRSPGMVGLSVGTDLDNLIDLPECSRWPAERRGDRTAALVQCARFSFKTKTCHFAWTGIAGAKS